MCNSMSLAMWGAASAFSGNRLFSAMKAKRPERTLLWSVMLFCALLASGLCVSCRVAQAEHKTGGPLFVVKKAIYMVSADYKSCGRVMTGTWRCRGPQDCTRKAGWMRRMPKFFNVGVRLVNKVPR